MKIQELGHYQTREGEIACITRVQKNRAYGHLISTTDTTWWYAASGEHGLYVSDDLIRRVVEK